MDVKFKTPSLSIGFKSERVYPGLEDLEVTPSTEEQKIKSSKYGFDNVTVKKVTADIDSNIKPEYIKEGINILGIDGGYSGIDTSDATATAGDLLKDKTAYANGEKIVGTIEEYDGSFEGSASEGAKITDATELFYEGRRTDYINELLKICENVTSTYRMFNGCANIKELDLRNFDASNVNTMQYMFQSCRKLEKINLSNFDTTNVNTMNGMFNLCEKLTELDLSTFNTINVTSMYNMFQNCGSLVQLNLSSFDTRNLIDMGNMFNSCFYLTDLDLSSFGLIKTTSVYNLFYKCSNLTNLKSFKNLGKGYTKTTNNYANYTLDLSSCNSLTYESLLDVITNGLYDLNLTYDVANGGTLYRQSLKIGSTNLAKLTEEEIAIATAKGWDVT